MLPLFAFTEPGPARREGDLSATDSPHWTRLLRLIAALLVASLPHTAAAQDSAFDREAFETGKQQAAQLRAQGDIAGAIRGYRTLFDRYASGLSADEYRELTETLAKLDREAGRLVIRTAPGTEVWVDGSRVGTTPLEEPIVVTPGARTLKLSKPGHQTLERKVLATGGTSVTVEEQLQPETTTGELAVRASLPSGEALEPGEELTLHVDGQPVGTLPWRGALAPGQHELRIESARFVAAEQDVVVEANGLSSIIVPLQPRPAHLKIAASGATIKLNDKVVAQNSFDGDVAPGTYVVSVERPGFDTYTTNVEARPGQLVDVPVPAPSTSSAAPAGAEVEDPGEQTGIYLDIAALGMFGTRSTHGWRRDCPTYQLSADADQAVTCETTPARGGALGVRFGFKFQGLLGVEAIVMGTGDWSSAKLKGLEVENAPSALSNMQAGRVGGLLGGGMRFTTPGRELYGSLGIGGGLVLRRLFTNVSSLDGSSVSYVAPALVLDLSIVLSNRLAAGLFVWSEFTPEVAVKPKLPSGVANPLSSLGSIVVHDGKEIFVGPMFAVHIGE